MKGELERNHTILEENFEDMEDDSQATESVSDFKFNNVRNACVLGFSFLILFMAFDSMQNLVTLIFYQEQGLNTGFYSLAALYGSSALMNFLSVEAEWKLGVKRSLVLGCLGFLAFSGACLALSRHPDIKTDYGKSLYGVVLTCSVLCGLSSSILWIGAGDQLKRYHTGNREQMIAIFANFLLMSRLLGNACAGAIFITLDHSRYFMIMAIMIGVSILIIILFLDKPRVSARMNHPEYGNIQVRKTLLSNPIFQHRVTSDSDGAPQSFLRKAFAYMLQSDMKPMLPVCVLSGFMLAYFVGLLPILIGKASGRSGRNELEITAFILTIAGLGEVLGGSLTRKMNINSSFKYTLLASTFLAITTFIFTYVAITVTRPGFYPIVWCISSFVWSFSISSLNISLQGICIISQNKLRALSVIKLYQSLGATAGFIYGAYTKESDELGILVALSAIGVVAVFVVFAFLDTDDEKERRVKEMEKAEKQKITNDDLATHLF